MGSLNSPSRNGSVGLTKIGPENLELVCCFLPVLAIGVFAQCSHETKAAGESDAVWRAQLCALAEEYPYLSNHFDAIFAEVSAGCSARLCFQNARIKLRSWQLNQAAQSWRSCDNSSLKELGAVIDANTGCAQFVLFEPIVLPIKAIAALELLRCMSAQDADPSISRGKRDPYRRAAMILGKESLHMSLRRLEGKVGPIRNNTVKLGEFLLSEWPQPKIATAAAAQRQLTCLPPFVAISSERAFERTLSREMKLLERERLAHKHTKAALENATKAAAELEREKQLLVAEVSRIPQLERVMKRLEDQLSRRPTETAMELMKADILDGHKKMRALARQSEDAAARGNRVAAGLRRERDAAKERETKKGKECEALLKEQQAAVKLAADAVRRAEMIRTGVAAVAAESRALAAETRADQAETRAQQAEESVAVLKSKIGVVREKASIQKQQQQAACKSLTHTARSAQSLASELQQQVAAGSAQIAALQRNLDQSFSTVTGLQEALMIQKEQAMATKCAAEAELASAVAEVKDNMVRAAVLNPQELCQHSNNIVSAKLKCIQAGEVFKPKAISIDKAGNITHRGRARSFMALVDGTKNADKVGDKQLRNRAANLNSAVNLLACGEAHAATLIADHAKANPKLYKLIGSKLERKLDVEQTAAFCNETSGMLGAAMRRHLKGCGVQVASKAAVQAYFKESWEECETGKVTLPDPKRPGRVVTGAWLRVSDLLGVIQRCIQRFAENGELSWPSNISGQECWFQMIIDKGSAATKIVIKYNCIKNPDSVRNVSLVGMLDRVKDTYNMMSIFKPLFNQFNNINRQGLCVWSPWQQALPHGIKASAVDQRPILEFVDEASPPPAASIAAAQLTPPPRSAAPTFPDCGTCAKWGNKCPSKLRRSFASNGTGDVAMELDFGDGPGLLANTWCEDCVECNANEGGKLDALRRQWGEVKNRGTDWRRLRGTLGGDWLSISVPLGLGGPKNKQFCMVCLASLHDTNAAGVPHLPSIPTGWTCSDPRALHMAQPQLRAGTSSIEQQAAAFSSATAAHAAGRPGRKPEPASYDSCVEEPLVWAGGHLLDLISCTPLHYMLGITVDLINCLEWELKVLDSECGGKPLDGKLADELKALAGEASGLRAEVVRWEGTMAHHQSSLEVIEATSGAAEAIERGKRPAKRSRSYTPLALESEYRTHLAGVRDARAQLDRLSTGIDTLKRKAVKVSAEEPGPFALSFFDVMNQFDFQRQAYHSGALVGNDCQKVLQPNVTKALTDLLRPRIIESEPSADPYDKTNTGKPYKILGSELRADSYLQLLTDFGLLTSLFMRKTPLCAHLIRLFVRTVESFAVRYAHMFPGKEPPPKVHGMCYHMVQQMLRLGGTGFLSESVVEAMHVVDNRMVSRYACVKNMEEQLRCRARAIWQLNNPKTTNLRKVDNDIAARKRERHAAGHRMRRMTSSQLKTLQPEADVACALDVSVSRSRLLPF